MNKFSRYVMMTIKYPNDAANRGIQGIAHVKFLVSRDGEVKNVRLMNYVHPDLATEAIRIVKLSKGWIPGVYKGRKIDVSYHVPISFTLSY